MVTLLVLSFLVLLASAICSCVEAALFSVSTTRARQLAEMGVPSGKTLLRIREHMSRPIATIVVFTNLANIGGSFAISAQSADTLGNDSALGQVLIAVALSVLMIIFSEILPKTFGELYAEPIALRCAGTVSFLTVLLTPVTGLIEMAVRPFTQRPVRGTTDEAEISLLAHIGQKEGAIEADEAEMIQRVFRLNDNQARQIMTPRAAVSHLPEASRVTDVRDLVLASTHSRLIVVGPDGLDDVRGMALRAELMRELVLGGHRTVGELAHDVKTVSDRTRADQLLAMFRRSRRHLAVVRDDFGDVVGVVTLEDVLELLTGEIVGENDPVLDLAQLSKSHGGVASPDALSEAATPQAQPRRVSQMDAARMARAQHLADAADDRRAGLVREGVITDVQAMQAAALMDANNDDDDVPKAQRVSESG